MDDLAVVGVGDGVGDRDEVRHQREALVARRALIEDLLERPSGDQLHRVERRAVGPPAGLVDRDDAGVLETRGDQRLAKKTQLAGGAAMEQLLQRDVPAHLAIVRAIDAAEATTAVLAEDVIAGRIAILERRRQPRQRTGVTDVVRRRAGTHFEGAGPRAGPRERVGVDGGLIPDGGRVPAHHSLPRGHARAHNTRRIARCKIDDRRSHGRSVPCGRHPPTVPSSRCARGPTPEVHEPTRARLF